MITFSYYFVHCALKTLQKKIEYKHDKSNICIKLAIQPGLITIFFGICQYQVKNMVVVFHLFRWHLFLVCLKVFFCCFFLVTLFYAFLLNKGYQKDSKNNESTNSNFVFIPYRRIMKYNRAKICQSWRLMKLYTNR